MTKKHLYDIELITIKKNKRINNNRHSFSLIYSLHGSFELDKEGTLDYLNEDNFYLMNHSDSLMIKNNNQHNHLLHVRFYFSEIEKIIADDWRPFFNDVKLVYMAEEERVIFKEKFFRFILDAFEVKEAVQPFISTSYLLSFLQYMNKTALVVNHTKAYNLDIDSGHPKIQSMIAHIEKHYANRLSLTDFAKNDYVSEAYLSRLFKEETGITFSRFVDQVRLQHATADLRQTSLPVITIALNNGFPSAKRLTEVFKKKYHVTPNDYRKKESAKIRGKQEPLVEEESYHIIPQEEAVQFIAQYMLSQNIKQTGAVTSKKHTISVEQEQSGSFNKPQRVINIGLAENGLSEDVRQQIRILQEKIPFDYIRFFGLCEEVDHQHYVITDKHVNNYRLFSFINEMRLQPMIVLTVTEQTTLEAWQEQLCYIRQIIQGYVHFEASFRLGWYIEINVAEHDVSSSVLRKLYDMTYDFLHENFTTGHVSLNINHRELSVFKEVIAPLIIAQRVPDILSISYRDYALKSDRSQGSHVLFLEELDALLALSKGAYNDNPPKLFVTEWNILASDNHILSGTFFRSGIVLKAMVELSHRVDGVGFWLNLESEATVTKKSKDSNLSVFLHGPLKRPLYFVLTLLDRIGEDIIYQSERYLVTKKFNSYYLLYYNYYFLNPTDTAYENLWKTSQKEEVFQFVDLPKGRYLVKEFLLDSQHGGIYHQWLKAGGFTEMDTDVQEYLLQSVVPDFNMKEIVVDDGTIEEQITLEMNACYLLIMNRVESLEEKLRK